MSIAERTKEQAKPAERESPPRTPAAGATANGAVAHLARLAGAVGNRAMTQLISRDNGTVVKDKPKDKAKPDTVTYNKPSSAYEMAFKKKFGDRASISVKFTASAQKQTKIAEAKTGDKDSKATAALSFWENKAMRERAAGKSVDKIQAALMRGELSGELLPGLKVKANTKLLEMQVEKAKDEAEIALLTVSVLIEGDISKWWWEATDVPEEARSGAKITVTGEAKIAPQLSDLARLRDMQKARKQAMAASDEIAKAAKRAKEVEDGLQKAQREARRLQKEVDSLGDYGRKNKKRFKTREAFDKFKASQKQQLAEQLEKKAVLETEKSALKATLKSQGEVLKRSEGIIRKAASGLKSKAGGLLGKALATTAGKAIARKLAYAIPILNVIAIAWDIIEIVGVFRKLWNGAKIGFGGDGGDEGEPEGDKQGSGGGDAKAPDAGAGGGDKDAGGGTGGDKDTQGSGGTGTGPDVTTPPPDKAPDGGTQGGPSDAPGTTVGEPPPPLHAGAQSVAEALKNGGIQLDKDQVWQLDGVIPKDFTADQMKELIKRLEAMKGGTGAMDPYELIGLIQGEVEKVRRGHDTESELTWVDNQFSEVLSTGAPADVLKKEAAAEEAKDQPPPQPGGTPPTTPPDPKAKQSKDAADKAADAAGGEKAKKPQPKKGKGAKPPPKSLMPDLPGGYLTFDEKANKFDWSPGGYDKLTGTFYNLSDGLEVAVTRAEISQQVAGDVILLSLGFEVEVQTLPPKAGKDYPWKVGEQKVYFERYSYNYKTGEVRGIEANTAGTTSARSVLALKADTVVLVGKNITFGKGISVRVDSISDQARDELDDATEFTVTLHVTVTAAPPKGHTLIDVDQNPVTLLKGKTAKIRMSIYRDKPKAGTK